MMRSLVILLISVGPLSIALSQPLSLEVRLSYLPTFSEQTSSPASNSEYRGFDLVAGAILYNFDGPIPITIGLSASVGTKILSDYHPSLPPPPGAGDASMSRKIRLFLVELPVLYRFTPVPMLTIRAGGRLGHLAFNRMDHIMGADYNEPANRVIFSPSLDIAFCPLQQLQLIAGIDYRPIKVDYTSWAPAYVSYSMDHISLCVGIGYVI